MKKFREIAEKAGDTAVFTFGRFNPPTIGHEKLINALAKQQSKNAGSKMYVYASKSNDAQKNPLPYAKKIAYMRKMFKKYSRNIVTGKPRTAIEVAVELYDKGHRAIVMVVGSDRVAEFNKILEEYNGVEGKRHGYYGFDNIEVVSAGERDPDGEGVAGMSASKMRAAAEKSDFDSFKTGIPDSMSDADKKKMYFDVRKGQGIREERDMGNDYDSLRDAYLTGKIWNVGESVEAKGLTGEIVRKGTNYLSFVTEDGKVHKAWLHEVELNENASVYEKTARKNKNDVTYAFGRTKKLDGQPKEKGGYWVWKLSQNYDGKVKGGIRNSWSYVAKDLSYSDAVKLMNKKLGRKEFKEEVELDELSSPIPWLNKAVAKISQVRHPKGWEKIAKEYVDGMKDPEHRKHPSAWAAEIAQRYRGVESRDLIKYINNLVKKGKLPKELEAELTIEAKSPLDRLKSFDKSRTAVGKKPIFKDKGDNKFVRMKKKGQMTIMNVPSDEVERYKKKGYVAVEQFSFKDFVQQIQEVKQVTDIKDKE